MNRCTSLTSALATALCAGLLTASAAHAQAVQRNFPAKALRGTMVVAQPPLVAMDDRPNRFAPGARILDTENRVLRSASLIGQEHVVNYTTDLRGQIHQVWILTAAEAKEKRPGYGTERNFTFESLQPVPAGAAENKRN
ncbi:hypothetical protein [Hydrogenophaga sp. BPS33]|uniref:hypothetical protein n=1 Tax=Hydrogenophaga sp. BPS33 TaxID=2651974 RepID=UPI001917180D|nr:hypothetical protein [Hydrogenophaga sp. BPS33]